MKIVFCITFYNSRRLIYFLLVNEVFKFNVPEYPSH
jgi:hypothetical protein